MFVRKWLKHTHPLSSMSKALIEIVGSLNVDFVTTVPRFPDPGETLTALSFERSFGGKGANQAVACSHQSQRGGHEERAVDVEMIGAVGDEPFGREYLTHLTDRGVSRRLFKLFAHFSVLIKMPSTW